jgi:uncharacterized protein YndB with AHSA1/START domain
MMRRVLCQAFMLMFAAGLMSGANGQNVTVAKMALMSFTSTIEVKASPAQVWAAITEPAKAKAWYPSWKNAKETQALATVGQSIGFVDEWANAGKSVVLFVDKNKELRVAHMPNDGSYVCQVKFKLEPKGPGTVVTIVDQYSDDINVPLDKDTAAKVKEGMTKYMASFKATVEGAKSTN